MSTQNHLHLRPIGLDGTDEWACKGKGLLFILVREGKGIHVSDSVSRLISAGDVLVQDWTAGVRLCVSRNRVTFEYFSVGLEQLFPLLAMDEIRLLGTVTALLRNSKLYPASSALARKCHQFLQGIPSEFNLDHRSQLLRIAATLLAAELETAETQRIGSPAQPWPLGGILKKLSMVEFMSQSIGELASTCSCSRRHLNRLFHQQFGISAAVLKMEMRLRKAVSLLNNTDISIVRVAEECGFNHLGSFNMRFKRRFGVSPRQWRKLAAQNTNRGNDPIRVGTALASQTGISCPVESAVVQEPHPVPVGMLRLWSDWSPNDPISFQLCALTASKPAKINGTNSGRSGSAAADRVVR